MVLTDEQVRQIKDHLLKQLPNFPEDKREQIRQQVESMDAEQVETFIKQNQLTHLGEQCIFCSIVAGINPSYSIGGNNENIAILEINPLSKGHSLIVPKEHLDKIKSSTQELAEEVAKKLREKLNPKRIELKEIKIMEHALIEIIPLYGGERKRKPANEDELKALQEEITKPLEIKIEPKNAEPVGEEELFKLPPRIPD